jgi:hypothetical protein
VTVRLGEPLAELLRAGLLAMIAKRNGKAS